MKKNMKHIFINLLMVAAVPLTASLVGCSEKIDESNLYTFTGETIEDYLNNRPEKFRNFNYILERTGYDQVLSAYGTYTCFAPSNEALQAYIDSLYDDLSNKDLPHNGMTAKGFEGLTDSLCRDIALYHLLYTEVKSVNMSKGATFSTILRRDVNTSIDPGTGEVLLNSSAALKTMDVNLENGMLHEISRVIPRSNDLVNGIFERHQEYSIFNQALKMTGLADSLTRKEKLGIIHPTPETSGKGTGAYIPKECREGFTVFAEEDKVLAQNGINSIDDLVKFANQKYEHCADASSGWYDYYRDRHVKVSTGNDYESPYNALNMFVRYHIVKLIASNDKLVHMYNETPSAPVFNYYETMLPYTLLKVENVLRSKLFINRWTANSTLTDQVAELASPAIAILENPGVEIGVNSIQAINGYIHNIWGMLVYDDHVPNGVLKERLRFDFTDICNELMSNNLRQISGDEIKALNGGKSSGSFGGNGGPRIPENYFDNIKIYNGNNSKLYYLPGQDIGWQNYEGDELLCFGAYDFAVRLPPVPNGTYEFRMGYSTYGGRGMMQVYIGSSSNLNSMIAVGIPIDMRYEPVVNQDNSPDVITGWCDWRKTDDQGVESDVNMHNLGFKRAPMSFTVGPNGTNVRSANTSIRRILAKFDLTQGEHWVRFKTVLPDHTNSEFHLDYFEIVPENVFNNSNYAEDMY